jgi:hypothetical protein
VRGDYTLWTLGRRAGRRMNSWGLFCSHLVAHQMCCWSEKRVDRVLAKLGSGDLVCFVVLWLPRKRLELGS